jgi:putative aldouronate transport system permease protein
MKVSIGRRLFEGINFLIMLGLCAVIVLPFVHIIAISLSNAQAITRMEVGLIPKGFYLDAYKKMVVNHVFVRGFINTIFITLIYTSLAIIICIMSAYAFSRKFYGKKALNYFFIITMYFNGGLIPTYIWVAKYLKMYNTYLVLIIPGLVSVFYIIVVRTQIEQIPISLIEAAIIDGANQFQVLFRIIIPTIKPTIAAICMFLVLGKWNGWFDVLVYIRDKDKWTMQYYLREVVFTASMSKDLQDMAQVKLDEAINISPENLKMAAIILVALPVLCVYPFVQKYFVKGMLAGSVKG